MAKKTAAVSLTILAMMAGTVDARGRIRGSTTIWGRGTGAMPTPMYRGSGRLFQSTSTFSGVSRRTSTFAGRAPAFVTPAGPSLMQPGLTTGEYFGGLVPYLITPGYARPPEADRLPTSSFYRTGGPLALVTQASAKRVGLDTMMHPGHGLFRSLVGFVPGSAQRGWHFQIHKYQPVIDLEWDGVKAWLDITSLPAPYDYAVDSGFVMMGRIRAATIEEYGKVATAIADSAKQPPANAQWKPLGTFTISRADVNSSTAMIQLATTYTGQIGGTYYNPTLGITKNVSGAIDKEYQRAAWRIEGISDIVMETGLSNLTHSDAPLLIHFLGDKVAEAWTSYRVTGKK